MSQTTRIMKEIASGEKYGALAVAIDGVDYEEMFRSYMGVAKLLRQGRETIEEGIKNLPVQNGEEHRSKFQRAFEMATRRLLPLWYELDQQLTCGIEQDNIMEGEVCGFGKKGDPLVRTPEGRIVVLTGSQLQEGERIMFRVVQDREKLSFGRVFALDAVSFGHLVTREAREKVTEALASIGDRLKTFEEGWGERSLAEIGEILRELEDVEQPLTALQPADARRVTAQVMDCRRRVLYSAGTRLMFDHICEREERDIEDFYRDGREEKAMALLAPGLFRRAAYEAARDGLSLQEEPEGYADILKEMDDNIDSMDSAMELMEFKSAIDGVLPSARRYVEGMDRLFHNLGMRVGDVADALARGRVVDPEELHKAIEDAFSETVLFVQLGRAFGSSRDFLSLRNAFTELNKRLRHEKVVSAEAAFRPYLLHKISQAFGHKLPDRRA